MKKPLIFTLAFLFLSLTAGCSADRSGEDSPRTVRIACCDETTFQSFYQDLFAAYFPDWEITYIPVYHPAGTGLLQTGNPDDPEELRERLEREKPDLVIVPEYGFRRLVRAGLLTELTGFSNRDRSVWEGLEAGVLERLQALGEGKLYGASPFFTADALYYNEDLFREYGVEPPDRPMTWREVLTLAGRFAGGERTEEDPYGFHMRWVTDSPYDLATRIAATEGLRLLDPQTGFLRLQTEGWRDVFLLVTEAYRLGAVASAPMSGREMDGVVIYGPEEMERTNLFFRGKAAMTVGGPDLMRELKAAKSFGLGVVPGPVHSHLPDTVGGYALGDVFAIPVTSGQPETAWEAIRFFLSERMGQISARLGGAFNIHSHVFARSKYPVWKGDPDYAVFYGLRPAPEPETPLDPEAAESFESSFRELFNRELQAVLRDEQTEEEALQRIENEGNALLAQRPR